MKAPTWPIVGAVLGFAIGCGSQTHGTPTGGDYVAPGSGQVGGPCADGSVRDCGIEIGTHDGVVDCAKGTQACIGGVWSACLPTGQTKFVPAPPPKVGAPMFGTQTVGGSSSTCTDDPCDPYCSSFDDQPDAAITSDATTTTTTGTTVSLADSNTPGGFKNKGSLDAQCATPCNTYACMSACQFDQHCGTKADGTPGCIAYGTSEEDTFPSSWTCSALPDITMPPVCTTDGNTTRNLTICNRGTADLTQNVSCYGYPGNSPIFPNDTPGVGNLVLATATTPAPTTANPITATNPIKAGTCRTYKIANSNFASSGTESIICNPQPGGSGTVTTSITSLGTTVSGPDWAPNVNVLSDTDATAYTSASMGQSIAKILPTSNANMSPAGSWATPTNAYSNADAQASTTSAFTSTTGAYQGPTTVVSNVGTGTGSPTWTYAGGATSFQDALASADGKFASIVLGKSSSSTLTLNMPVASVPAGAVIGGLHIKAAWSIATSKLTGAIRILKSDGTVLYDSGTLAAPGAATLDTGVVPLLSPITSADLAGLRVVLYAASASGAATYTESVDYVSVAPIYYIPSTHSIDYSGFTFGALGTITSLRLEVAWKSSVTTSNATYGIQAYDASGAAISTESTYAPTNAFVTSFFTIPVTGLTAASFGAGFKVHVRATRGSAANDPDWTAYVDYVRVQVGYTSGTVPADLVVGGFGFSLPATATNIKLTSTASWRGTGTLSATDAFGIEAINGTGWIGTPTWISPPPSTFTTVSNGAFALSSTSDVVDGNLFVHVGIAESAAGTDTFSEQVDWVKATVTYDAPALPAAVPECNPSNNWSVSKANPAVTCDPVTTTTYPPWTQTRVFQATCPAGYKPRWKYFGWDTNAPTGTSVEFRFRAFAATGSPATCAALPAVTSGSSPAPLVTAKAGTPDTQDCVIASPVAGVCPADIGAYLGGDPTDNQTCLQMDAYGIPATSPAAAPELVSWETSYDCVPWE